MNDDVPAGCGHGLRTGMADAVLREIAALLVRFAETGEPGAIDIKSLPLTPADQAELDERLGKGEATVKLSTSGGSDIWETSYAGVWRVRDFDSAGRIVAEKIEITRVPEIVMAHEADIRAAATRMADDLGELTGGGNAGTGNAG
jgi:hydrogenase-1 operon protein HyaF